MMQQTYPSIPHPYAFELNKDFHFAAAHYIPDEKAGKCQQVHGHTYFINITVAGDKLDSSGFLVNFSELKQLVHNQFDHTMLNDHTDYFDPRHSDKFPTTEVVAKTIASIVQDYLDQKDHKPKCVQVFVRETPTSYVIYRPKGEKDQENEER